MQATIPNRRLVRRAFNLIEIVLALTVIAIGMLAIIGLIPIGTKATREAIGNNYAADAADQTLHRMAAWIRVNWDVRKDEIKEFDEAGDISEKYTEQGGWNWMDPPRNTLGYSDMYPDGVTTTDRVYFLRNANPQDDTRHDFIALVRIWKSKSAPYVYDPTLTPPWQQKADETYDSRMQLNMEVTWPATLPYDAREKAYYTLEVIR